jgi:hypothetical protein
MGEVSNKLIERNRYREYRERIERVQTALLMWRHEIIAAMNEPNVSEDELNVLHVELTQMGAVYHLLGEADCDDFNRVLRATFGPALLRYADEGLPR